jgi:hypothetical protein
MDAIEESHGRPEGEILHLRSDEALPAPARARAGERGAEERAVREMGRETGGPPALPVAREESAEQANVGVAGRRTD